MKTLSKKYATDEPWWEGLPPQQLKSKARQRVIEIEAELKKLCSYLAQYFENTKTYEEIQTGIENDIEANDAKNFQEFLSSYGSEGTRDGRDYSTILSSLKQTTLTVMALDHEIDNGTDKTLLQIIPTTEDSFTKTTLCFVMLKAVQDPLTKKNAVMQDARREGGKKRAESYQAIKDEVAQLLHYQRPPTGWKNKADAARRLADSIAQFQRKYPEQNRLQDENIPERIRRWLYEDKALDSIFKQTKKTN